LAGADIITVHLREDRRHIQDRDVFLLRRTVNVKLNLEMAASAEIISLALKLKPDQVTLVPEKRREITTEGGLGAAGNVARLKSVTRKFHAAGVLVSFFIDPDIGQVEAGRRAGADFIELHTGSYANAPGEDEREKEFQRLDSAARLGAEIGLRINAGHGLDYHNVKRIASLPCLEELHIGHSIVSRAVFVGLERAVREMRAAAGI
jgi:pyridoxine 5-phosphate synthase